MMKYDRARRTDTRPAQSFGPETVFAPCQRREHHLLSDFSIRGFLTSDLPTKVRRLLKPNLLPAHTRRRAGSGNMRRLEDSAQ